MYVLSDDVSTLRTPLERLPLAPQGLHCIKTKATPDAHFRLWSTHFQKASRTPGAQNWS
jgi:hypothetical protein